MTCVLHHLQGLLGNFREHDDGGKTWYDGFLQVASRTLVYIFDLLALRGTPELGTLLMPLMTSPHVTKVGVGLADDMRRLAASCPGVKAASRRGDGGVTDLQALWRARLQAQGVQVISCSSGHALMSRVGAGYKIPPSFSEWQATS